MNKIEKRLREMAIPPSKKGGEFDIWLEQKDAFAFLKEDRKSVV